MRSGPMLATETQRPSTRSPSQRAQIVVQAAKADYGYALDANKIFPGTVSESEISRLRAALDLAEIDLRQVGLADPERNVPTAEQPAQPREEERKTHPEAKAGSLSLAQLPDLLKERRETLRQQLETTDKRYCEGNAALASVLRVVDQLLEAELELATTKAERISVCERTLAALREKEAAAKARVDAGIESGRHKLLEARAARLKVEAKLSQEQATPSDVSDVGTRPAPQSANRNWPEVERTLYADMSGKECGIDLDTGKLYTLPKEYNRVVYPRDEILRWAEDHHIDLFYPANPSFGHLACVGFGPRAFDNTTWEKVTREDVRDFFSSGRE